MFVDVGDEAVPVYADGQEDGDEGERGERQAEGAVQGHHALAADHVRVAAVEAARQPVAAVVKRVVLLVLPVVVRGSAPVVPTVAALLFLAQDVVQEGQDLLVVTRPRHLLGDRANTLCGPSPLVVDIVDLEDSLECVGPCSELRIR